MVESYVAEEAVEFCADNLSRVDPIGVPVARNMTSDGLEIERPLPGGYVVAVDREEFEQAHRYVLENSSEVEPYIVEHMAWLKVQYPRQEKSPKWLQVEHNRTFIDWIHYKVADELNLKRNISNTLEWIA
ncbi:uncharacterized protein LOC131304783 [Rhododendron vialii]|uniref:uncharacterized protein LOC131304783 n=1 Tax=Rhododendron vialii TaxID=182163 RepID=UPI00266019D5|nr:uncharacterized protein LOC131304783 [Rhododendron vialii]